VTSTTTIPVPPKGPEIARDFLFALRSRYEVDDSEEAVSITRRYIQNASESIFAIRKAIDDANQDKLQHELTLFAKTCRELAHPALTVLCEQLEEMTLSGSKETCRSILNLIQVEHDRIRPRLLELDKAIEQHTDKPAPPPQTEIMVVDDDLFSREIAKDLLEQEGFLVQTVASGEEALANLETRLPDLVLLDIDMPGLDGVQTCRQIRQLDSGEHLPVIMMTGHQDESAIERSFAAKATDFAHKPLNWPVLLQRLRYISRSSQTLNDLYRTQKRLAEAQRIARIGHWDHDLNNNQLMLSDQFYEVIGYPVGSFVRFEDFLKTVETGDQNTLQEAFCKHHRSHCGECRIRTPSGESRVIRIKGSAVYSANNEPLWMMGTVQDVSDQRRDQEIIHRLAYYDDLTGLYNRVAFNREMERVLNLHQRMNLPVAIAYMDLDGFKRINDSLGHHTGDLLLKVFATRLNAHLRDSDLMIQDQAPTVARLGGDEFTLMLPGLKRKEDSAIVAQRIVDFLQYPFLLAAETTETLTRLKEIYITTSIGIALFPEDGTTLTELQRNADMAMYAAKQSGKNTFAYYQHSMNANAQEMLKLETHLRKAIDLNELSLVYQPQLEITTGRIVGVEALLRWHNPELGNVSPVKFIPAAEETGLIIAIGEWVLREACQQMTQWHDKSIKGIDVAVNLSGLQFRQPNFPELVEEILNENQLSASFLELELTESMLMGDVEKAITTMEQLRELGAKLSVDDFGTGYSSLSYLRRFPIDTLKIDRSFINEIGIDQGGEAITKAIISMGQSLGMRMIAEGVENHQQLDFLIRQNCEIVQGYLYSPPLSPEQFEAFYWRQSKQQQSA